MIDLQSPEEKAALEQLAVDFPDIAERIADVNLRIFRATQLLHGYGDPEVREAIRVIGLGLVAVRAHAAEAGRRYSSRFDEEQAEKYGRSYEDYCRVMEKSDSDVDREAYERGLAKYRERYGERKTLR